MTFKVLSLSGGGFMGLYSAIVLAELERRQGKPIAETFDLIAGTSIGGVIGLGLAAGVPAAQIVDGFMANGERIFSGRQTTSMTPRLPFDMLRFIRAIPCSNAALRSTIEEFVGDRTMADLSRRALVPAVDITNGRPHLFRTPHAAGHSGDVKLVDVALATSAAPIVFPMHQIGDIHYADGGIFAQSPDALALTEATAQLGVPESEISMLSIGTTTGSFRFGAVRSAALGLRDWIENKRLIRITVAMQQQSAAMQMQARLGDRYLRIDSAQSREDAKSLGMDIACANARARLTQMAQQRIAGFTKSEMAAIEGILGERADPGLDQIGGTPEQA